MTQRDIAKQLRLSQPSVHYTLTKFRTANYDFAKMGH